MTRTICAAQEAQAFDFKTAQIRKGTVGLDSPTSLQIQVGYSAFAGVRVGEYGVVTPQPLYRQQAGSSRHLSGEHSAVRVILKLQSYWGLGAEEFLRACGLPNEPDQSVAQALAKYFAVPDVKRRLRSLMAIRSRLSAMLGGDQQVEKSWLLAPWPRLADRTPMAQITSGEFEDLLQVEVAVREVSGT